MKINRGLKIFLFVAFAIIFAITLWEHIATETQYQYKPTYFVNTAVEFGQIWCRYIGQELAKLLSFLEHIKRLLEWMKLKNYLRSVLNLLKSCGNLAMVWVWTIYGYIDYLRPLTQFNRDLTITGTIIICVLSSYIFYKYLWTNQKNTWFAPVKNFILHNANKLFSLSFIGFFGLITYIAYNYKSLN